MDVIALGVGADREALRRVLRLLATQGIFEVEGSTAPPDRGRQAAAVGPPGIAAAVRPHDGPVDAVGDGRRPDVGVRTGQAAAPRLFEGGAWGWLQDHPAEEAVFGQAMAATSAVQIADVIASVRLRPPTVGSSTSAAVRATCCERSSRSAEGVKGVLFDQPAVVERARGTDERLAFVGGDLFTTPLPAGDLFILHEVLHDWDDAHCAELLGAVRRAMPSGSRLLIIEVELAEDGPRWPKLLDVLMLAVFGARQRTNDEYRALLTASEFEITGQTSTPGGLTLIEAVP